jgi:transcriptional regulator with XRE-family HTH domain
MTETPLSDIVAGRVRELRQRWGWSAARLAERCAEVGAPQLTASVIANIESGRRDKQGRRRREVTVDEARYLGLALSVPIDVLMQKEGAPSADEQDLVGAVIVADLGGGRWAFRRPPPRHEEQADG